MRLIDISMTIHPDMEVYPGDTPPGIYRLSRLDAGDPYNISRIILGTHTGTHVDPPLHFIMNGTGIDKLPMEMLVGPARVLDLSHIDRAIEPGDLDTAKAKEIILIKGPREGACLTTATAQYFADKGIRTIGTDALSISTPDEEHEVHHILLDAGIVIIEGLDLSCADAGEYFFVCLPLKIADGDGGPARAVLIADI